jgi:hypothetical protein
MPATSVKQRRAMAIAEHNPDQVFARNSGLLKMSHKQLHDFATTSEKGLPEESEVKKGMKAVMHRKKKGSK